jgi:hypothetical protein
MITAQHGSDSGLAEPLPFFFGVRRAGVRDVAVVKLLGKVRSSK